MAVPDDVSHERGFPRTATVRVIQFERTSSLNQAPRSFAVNILFLPLLKLRTIKVSVLYPVQKRDPLSIQV